jgi:hypothetical protein
LKKRTKNNLERIGNIWIQGNQKSGNFHLSPIPHHGLTMSVINQGNLKKINYENKAIGKS